ncbi:MAG: haloacid dehalogenase type II [Acidobacteria bacterium]|nr:haloacid dehalogenase type II [Acidobacteriota bacterium]
MMDEAGGGGDPGSGAGGNGPDDPAARVRAVIESLCLPHEIILIEPAFADTAAFCEQYDYPLEHACNTIIVASRKEPKSYIACVVLATTRLDVNRRAKKLLCVNKASFATAEEMKVLTGMEVGGVTPLALPAGVPLFVDARIMVLDWVIIGGGGRGMKIRIAPEAFTRLGAEIVDDLGLMRSAGEGGSPAGPADAGRVAIRPEVFTHLTFDCYGTLVYWERGILSEVGALLQAHGMRPANGTILDLYAKHEAAAEARPYRPYRQILRDVMAGIAADLDVGIPAPELDAFPDSITRWPPFPDTVDALGRLKERYRLVILSNVDDDLFRGTARHLEVPFDEVITAQQVGAYKPSPRMFEAALHRLGVSKERILHVAQSLYHDHAPAKRLGLTTVRVNRKSLRRGTGLAPHAEAMPDLEVPDLNALARALGL